MKRKLKYIIYLIVIIAIILITGNFNEVYATEDTEPPIVDVSSIVVSKTQATSGDKVKIQMKITDNSGYIKYTSLYYTRPVTNARKEIDLKYNEETELFEAEVEIDNNWISGIYKIDYIFVSDGTNSEIYYNNKNPHSLVSLGVDMSGGDFEVIGTTADSTLPTIYPETLTVSNQKAVIGDSIKYSVKITDNVAIEDVTLWLRDENGSSKLLDMIYNNETKLYEAVFKIESSTEGGEWKIDYIYVIDTNDNYKSIHNGDSSSRYDWSDKTIYNYKNYTSPEYQANSLATSSASITKNESIDISLIAMDKFGINNVKIYYKKPSSQEDYMVEAKFSETQSTIKNVYGNYYYNKYVATIPFEEYGENGTWKIDRIEITSVKNIVTVLYNSEFNTDENAIDLSAGDFTTSGLIEDIVAPNLNSYNISKNNLIQNEDTTITIEASDEKSGIKNVIANYTLPNGIEKNYYLEKNNDKYTTTINHDIDNIGKYQLNYILVEDYASNVLKVDNISNLDFEMYNASISIVGDNNIILNKSKEYSTTIYPSIIDDNSVTWSIENETGVASIDGNGKVTAISEGTVIIKATLNKNTDIFATKKIKINKEGSVEGIFIVTDNKYLGYNESIYLKAYIYPNNVETKDIIWKSSDTSIASINETTGGLTTKNKAGNVTITATATDGSETYGTIELKVGETYLQVGEEISISNSTSTSYHEANWEIEDMSIIRPTGSYGKVTISYGSTVYIKHSMNIIGLKNGSTMVKLLAISGDVIASGRVNVFTPIQTITCNKERLDLDLNESAKLEFNVFPNTISNDLKKIICISEDDSIASIDSRGNVTAKKVGKTNIIAYSQYFGVMLTIPVNVEILPKELILEDTEINLGNNETTHQIKYTINPSDATNKNVVFESKDESIATVSEDGIITGIRNGTTVITVKAANGKIEKEINVTVSGFETNINKLTFEEISDFVYDGNEKKTSIIIKDRSYTLIENIDYTVQYDENINAGIAKAKIQGINYYSGEKIIEFEIKEATIDYNARGKTVTYDGNKYSIDMDVKTEEVIIKYANENGEYVLTEIPTYTDAGTYIVKYQLTKQNYKTIEESKTIIIEKAKMEYFAYDRHDYSDEYKEVISSDYDNIQIHVEKPNTDYTIRYADENGNYTLDTAPFNKKAGRYLINFEIASKNFETIRSSIYRNNYGIRSLHPTLEIRDTYYLIIKDYTTNFNSIINKINVYSDEYGHVFKHTDSINYNANEISSPIVKTGEAINMFVGPNELIQMHGWTVIILGDVNCDGKISALDYVKIKNHIMGTNLLSAYAAHLAADVNDDSKISALDYVRIKNYIMNGGI